MTDELSESELILLEEAKTEREAQVQDRLAQLAAWKQFQEDHPIAARKAKQRAEADARKQTRINLSFGKINMAGRE